MKRKIAIIGLNDIGKHHFSELRRSDYFELVGICDSLVNEDFGKFQIFKNIDDLFSIKKPDAILICTPCKFHKEIILKAMKYVKNILIQSPFALNLTESREINYALKSNNVNFAISCHFRFNPTINSIMREIKKDEKIYSISVTNGITDVQNFDLINEKLIPNLDLVRFILGQDITNFYFDEIKKNEKFPKVLTGFSKIKNEILLNFFISSLYLQNHWSIELSTNSGVYFGDLLNFTLYKITKNGRINLKVEKDDFSLKIVHKNFYDLCCGIKTKLNATGDDMVKIREILK